MSELSDLVHEGLRRRVVMRPIVPTLAQEAELYGIYNDAIRLWSAFLPTLVAEYDRNSLVAADGLMRDADGAQLQFLIDQIDRQLDNTILYQTEKLGRWVSKVGRWNGAKTISAIKSATGKDVAPFIRLREAQPFLEQSIRQNVALISNVNADMKNRVEQIIFDSLANRRTKKRLTDDLAASLGITKRRARNIATDQTHKLNAALNQFRNQQLGIETYIWQTRLDDRVRKLHKGREGKTFRWDQPPSDGHPGQPVMCRCGAQAILDPEDA